MTDVSRHNFYKMLRARLLMLTAANYLYGVREPIEAETALRTHPRSAHSRRPYCRIWAPCWSLFVDGEHRRVVLPGAAIIRKDETVDSPLPRRIKEHT